MSGRRLARDLWRAAVPAPLRWPVVWLVAGWLVGLAVVGTTPASPVALDRADASLARGRPDRAAARYDAVSRYAITQSVRRAALERGALVWSGELARPGEARERVEQLLAETRAPAERARLLAWSADLLVAERRLDEAADRYVLAASALPGTRVAGERLVAAARALDEAGRPAEARAVWRGVAREHPAQRGEALVWLASQALGDGDATRALRLYEGAVVATDDPQLAAVARLGAASCLERLGDLDSAIAELDGVDLPAPVRAEREKGLKTRQSAGAL